MSSSLKTNEHHSSASFADRLKNCPLPAFIFQREGFQIVAANLSAGELYGPANSASSISLLQLFSEQDRLLFFHQVNTHPVNDFDFHSFHINHKGERFPVQMHVSPVEGEAGMAMVVMMDLSKSLIRTGHAEEELDKYRNYMHHSNDGIFCLDFSPSVAVNGEPEDLLRSIQKQGCLTECNDALAKMMGLEKAASLLASGTGRFIKYLDALLLRHFINDGFRAVNFETQEKDHKGSNRYFLNNMMGMVEDGQLKRIWGTRQEITERKKTEAELRLLASLVEQTSDILTAADINYIPVSWNKAAEKVYGITAEQAIGHDLRKYISLHYVDSNRDEVRKVIAEKGEWRGAAYFVRPTDHKTIYLWMCFKALKDDEGRNLGFLVSAVDETDRKESESRLRESENRFREMADSSPVMIWMSDEQNRVTYLNQKWIDFTGNNILGDNGSSWTALVHKDDLAKAIADYHKAFESRKQVTLIYRLMHADGTYHWVHDVSVPRFLADGTFIGYIGSVVDIQDQKEKEQQLLYQAMILDNVSDIIVTTDTEFRIRSWNRIAEHYYETEEEFAVGRKMSEIVEFQFPDTDLNTVIHMLLTRGGWSGEASFRNRAGEQKYFHYTLKSIYDEQQNKIGYLSTGRDITEKKLADEKMKKSEQFYRTLIADSLDGMILLNQDGLITFASPSVKNVLGYQVDEIVGRNAFEFVHGEDLVWALTSFQKEVVENPEIKFIVIRLLTKEGNWVWCMVRGHNMLKNPSVNSIVVYFHDDTLRKQATDALKESEKKFRSLIRDLQVGVFLADNKGRILMCNKALATLLSAPEEMLVNRQIYDFMADDMINEKGEFIPLEQRPLSLAILSKRTVKDVVIGVLHPLTKERSWIMVNADPIMDENDEIRHVVCSVMDLTERKKLEQQLVADQIAHQQQLSQATIDAQEAERREIGKELHDNIGQQLTTIKLFLDLAKSTADESTHEMISMALKGVGDVINEIRAMSRSLVPSTLQDLGLAESIHDLVDSIERTQVMAIDLDLKDFDEAPLPENHKLALYRITQEQLNNIVKHAQAQHVTIQLKSRKGRSILEIRDDGCGFEPRKLRKGLGFMNIKNRTELLGGKNEIISQPGKGCLLRVSLPVSSSATDGIVAIG